MDKKAMAALAATPVSKSNSAGKTWVLTQEGLDNGANVGGQAGVILRGLASLGGTATTTALVEVINKMREEDDVINAIMTGKADQGTATIVAHYAGSKTPLRRKGYVING